jgi:NADH dehydrogenase FAD-containing subunit
MITDLLSAIRVTLRQGMSIIILIHSLKQLSLDYFIQYIQGTVTQIHRQDKTVTLDNKSVIPYEYLLLTPGLQFITKELHPKLQNLAGVHAMNRSEFGKFDAHLSHLIRTGKDGKVVM